MEAHVKKYFIYTGFIVVGALAVAAGSTLIADDSSGKNHVNARMNGYQENPSIVTAAKGTIDLRINDDTQTIDFEVRWSNLEGGSATASHIHIASRSFNGAVSAFFCGGGGKPPCPLGPDGSVSGTIAAADVIGPAAQGVAPGDIGRLIQAIRAGHTYGNVHNARYPGGEIRGQINDDDQRQFER
jgi:CHRD domain